MRTLIVSAIAAILLSGCGDDVTTQTTDPSTTTAPPSTTTTEPFTCPITIPPNPGHTPTSDHPATPSIEGTVWYGDDDLWTVVPIDGSHLPRKSVWWSADFDVTEDETPDLAVTWRRLDGDTVHTHPAPATNANTSEDGWFMINGIDPDEAGCWEVTATYREASLTYVYESS